MAPITYLFLNGHIQVPSSENTSLDIIPVDYIAGGMVAALGALLERTVVMDGASVAAGSALTECLLFPGAKVPSGKVAHRTIFTSESEIRCAGGELS
jgi:ADP-glucose pyrophosphorylase